MKITFDGRTLQHSQARGLGIYTDELIKELQNIDPNNQYEILLDPNLPKPINTYSSISIKSMDNAPFFMPFNSLFYNRYWLNYQFQKLTTDIFHIPSLIMLPPNPPKNSIVTVADLINLALKEQFYTNEIAYRADVSYFKNILKNKKIISISENTKKDIVNILKIPEENISVTYLGVNPIFQQHQTSEEIKRIKTKYNIDQEYFIYYGGSEERKNVALSINSFNQLLESKPNHMLVIITRLDDGPTAKLTDLVNKLKLTDKVKFIDALSQAELIGLLQGSLALVMPTFYEGFGLPPLEANASNVPVISSNSSSLPEVLGEAALFFNPNNKDELTNQMVRLIDNPELKAQLIEKGKLNIKRFSWKKCAEETYNIYLNYYENRNNPK